MRITLRSHISEFRPMSFISRREYGGVEDFSDFLDSQSSECFDVAPRKTAQDVQSSWRG